MFRKQGIDISSRGSFELLARLRIIVRVLSRQRSLSLSLPPHPSLLLSFSFPRCPLAPPLILLLLTGVIALSASASHFSSTISLSFFSCILCPRSLLSTVHSKPGYRSIYPAGPSLYFVHRSKCSREAVSCERTTFPPAVLSARLLPTVDPSGFYELATSSSSCLSPRHLSPRSIRCYGRASSEANFVAALKC